MSGTLSQFPSPEDPTRHRPQAHPRTLMLCDLADSTALFDRLGDQTATDLIRRHDQLARSAMQRHGGHEIDKTDGFLMLFERPIQAVAFALEYQRSLRALAGETKQSLNARVGIHFGEVVVWENSPASIAQGAKPLEVEGVAKPVTARLMALACPGQILLSEAAEVMAQRAERESGFASDKVRWLAHGRYHFKGLSEPIVVYEVGESGIAPLRAPPASTKAWPAAPWPRRRTTLAVLGLVLLAIASTSFYVSMRGASALSFGERDWVVIGDFVNVNGDKKIDPTLGTAFRIGIEESRFVNVVPDVSIRQALLRMQRDSTTQIDRDVGAEIALRERARAVIVPSVARYGPKLRLVVELIDPNDARTVSTQTADADGPNDILPAMDRLLRATRMRLGESLQQIQTTSQPLDKVATPNLDALRALTRALETERDGDFDQAERLLRHAIELDPNFATAHRTLGSVLVSQERYVEGRAALERALAINGRLTERERLFTRAFLAEFDNPGSALSQWRAFASLYPDNGTGQNNAGNLYYMVLHEYAAAEAAFTKAVLPRNPFRNFTQQLLGHTLLAEEKFKEAEQQFRAGLKISPAPMLFGLSDALVARGRFDEAAHYLDEPSSNPPGVDVERAMRRATLLIAQQKLPAAAAAIESALSTANQLPSPNARWRAQAAMIAVRVAQNDPGAARTLAAAQLGELSVDARVGANQLAIEELLYVAGWAARLGSIDEASAALELAKRQGALDRFPVRASLAAIAQAEIDLRAGHADAVLARLHPSDGDELWELHELRARALRATGDSAAERAELTWLTSHRGRAYAQWTDQLLGQQARAWALNEAKARLAQSAPPR